MAQSDMNNRNGFNTLLIVLVGQMGCLTLIVILTTVFSGIWLDNTFHTKPIFTLALLFAGIPLSVVLMVYVGRKTLAKLKENTAGVDKKNSI
jgi:hypothetical protein